jgi:hypothetical protein
MLGDQFAQRRIRFEGTAYDVVEDCRGVETRPFLGLPQRLGQCLVIPPLGQ